MFIKLLSMKAAATAMISMICAYDVMVSLAANAAVSDGVSPAAKRVVAEFPYYGGPFSASEQIGLKPIQGNIGYGTA
jgi:hypothetical protein